MVSSPQLREFIMGYAKPSGTKFRIYKPTHGIICLHKPIRSNKVIVY
jgi:hypothetical protein